MKPIISPIKKVLRQRLGWVFPLIVVLLVLTLSALRISGTSSGVYDYLLGRDLSNHLVGKPRPIRSDEWVVVTPAVAAQHKEQFPVYNTDIGAGQDMSIVLDAPYADWSMVFRPQNIAFLFLPLDIAFALKWWLLGAGLALAVYAFVLLLYPRRYLIASLLGGIMLFSPFVQWWYQSATILPIAYGLLGIVSVMKLVESRTTRTALGWFIALTYIAVCFALIMYPAFQLTIGLVAIMLTLGILWGRKELHLLWRRRNLLLLVGAGGITAGLLGLFLWQHHDAIVASLHTIYPGSRNIHSGGFDIFRLLNWPLSYLLLNDANATIFGSNQSEASGFLLIGLVIAPFLAYIAIKERGAFSRLEKALLYTGIGVICLFMLRMFVPFGGWLFGLVGMSKIPHERLLIGFGVINCILLLVAMGRSAAAPPKRWQTYADRQQLVFFIFLTLIYTILVYATIRHSNTSGVGPLEAVTVILAFSIPSVLLLSPYMRLRIVGLAGILLLGLGSSLYVNPLYRGIGVTNNEFSRYIATAEKADKHYWVANDSSVLSAIMSASGAEVYGGVNTYPQTSVWKKYFPHDEAVYNRYAHIRFLFDSPTKERSLSLIQADSFFVHLSPCDAMVKELNIRYITSERPLHSSCLGKDIGRIFDGKRIYIYTLP